MEAKFEKVSQRNILESHRGLVSRVGKEGNTPEGLACIKMAEDVRQATTKILYRFSKKPYSSLLAHQKYVEAKLQVFTEEIADNEFFATPIIHKKLYVLEIERYFLKKMGAGDISHDMGYYLSSPMVVMSLVGTYQAGQSYEAKLFCDTRKMDYEGDSVWVNGVFKKDKPFNISLPTLKAGKHTIHFKIKRLHKHIPEKDTTIFYTHHFTVLPK